MTSPSSPPSPFEFNLSFPHRWQAEILPARPAILPARHFVYPRHAEEVERGALELLIRPHAAGAPGSGSPRTGLRPWGGDLASETGEGKSIHSEQPFLATCALGFRDPAVPTGLWSTPNPDELCALSGGYAYLISTIAPERFTMLPYRPVLQVLPSPANGLLLFASHRNLLAWAHTGQLWESEKLSDEGITLTAIDGSILRGLGWQMRTDKEVPFALDLRTGLRIA